MSINTGYDGPKGSGTGPAESDSTKIVFKLQKVERLWTANILAHIMTHRRQMFDDGVEGELVLESIGIANLSSEEEFNELKRRIEGQ
jgi:hypothetical protein